MNCLECKGACCEWLGVHVPAFAGLGGTVEFLRARGQVDEVSAALDPVFVVLECRCPKLTDEGLCGIYDTRPMVCVDFEPGCPDCLRSVRARRTPEEYQRIRDEGDPGELLGP